MCSSKKQAPPPPVAAPLPPPDRLASALKPSTEETQRKRGSRNPLRVDLAQSPTPSTTGLNVV